MYIGFIKGSPLSQKDPHHKVMGFIPASIYNEQEEQLTKKRKLILTKNGFVFCEAVYFKRFS
jgi:hypothetical protein